tara:strand:+ start:834 stop:1052 length:219 start_codon:yes stop_codon:yes gene_type:complete
MDDLKKIYSNSIKSARVDANKKVSDAQRSYDILADKDSDYAHVIKSMLFLYKQSAEIYNNAPSEIIFEHEAF